MGGVIEMGKEIATPEDFEQSVASSGFVPTTAQVVTQMLANQAKIAGLEAAVVDLKAKVDGVDKGKKPK